MLWGGKPAEVVRAAENRRISIVTSEAIVEGISRVLAYPKLHKVYQVDGLCREELIEAVLRIVKFVNVTEKVSVVVEHLADDKFIECAMAAGADYLVSGDKHLLKLIRCKKTKILSVSELLQVIETK
ncbi:MAG: putative toxin-antitoxin system toxin component, PIN family [Candidatus Bathyarchaeia archaeon]